MKYFMGLLLVFFASTVAAKCGPGYGSCENGECCSKYGYCGTSSEYCGTGCQADFGICYNSGNPTTSTKTKTTKTSSIVSTNGRCGSNYGSCPNGECCSKYGYCGITNDYCSSGCQSSFGICNNSPTPTKSSHATSTNGRCGSKYGSCPSGYCCSKYGYCGTSSDHCGSSCQSEYSECYYSSTKIEPTPTKTSNYNFPISTNGKCGGRDGICPGNQCCSKYGYCGTSSNYCDSGCQSAFGQCNSRSTTTITIIKTKTTTTKTKIETSTNTNHPISTNGLCGKHDGICPNHECCSKYGYCGSDDDYCSTDAGCQSEFGRCGKYESDVKLKYYYECKNSNHWALSFDDGPYKYDNDLLDLLKEKGVKATFFINGDNVMDITSSEGRAIVKRMYNEGHVIGSHTWSHANLKELDRNGIISEMTKLDEAIYDIIGKKPALMRPPFGGGRGSDEIASILSDLGYLGACIWNVDTLDWDNTGDIDYALNEFKKYQGKPIMSLNHCYYKGISKEKLVDLARSEIDYMESQGYTAVTMDVCLGLNAYQ